MQKDNKLELLSDILDNIDSLEFIQDNHGKKYKSGQIIKFDNYFLLAFANLDNDGRAFMTKEDYLSCLLELWKEINKNYAQNNVCIPLLGLGTTKLVDWNPTQQELLDTIICSYKLSVNDTLRMYKNDDIRMYNFNCITDTIVEVITTCNTYTLLTVHLL